MKSWHFDLKKPLATALCGALLSCLSLPLLAQDEIIRGEVPPMPEIE